LTYGFDLSLALRGLLPTEVELKVEKLLEAVKNPDKKIVVSWAAALGVSASAIQAHITDRNLAQNKEYTFVDSSASSRGLGGKGSSPVTSESVCHSWDPQMQRSWPIVPIMANPLPTPPVSLSTRCEISYISLLMRSFLLAPL